jgi:hypothetical protein
MTVTPIFDQLNADWKSEFNYAPCELKLTPGISPEGSDAELASTLGTLPLLGQFKSSFPGEHLDFSRDRTALTMSDDVSAPLSGVQARGRANADDASPVWEGMPHEDMKSVDATSLLFKEVVMVCYAFNQNGFFDHKDHDEIVALWDDAINEWRSDPLYASSRPTVDQILNVILGQTPEPTLPAPSLIKKAQQDS